MWYGKNAIFHLLNKDNCTKCRERQKSLRRQTWRKQRKEYLSTFVCIGAIVWSCKYYHWSAVMAVDWTCGTNCYRSSVFGYVWPVANATINGRQPELYFSTRWSSASILAYRTWVSQCCTSTSLDCTWFSWWFSSSFMASKITWPNPVWFLFWGYVKDYVFVLPLPCYWAQLIESIVHAIVGIDRHMLGRANYMILVYRVTNGEHMEHL